VDAKRRSTAIQEGQETLEPLNSAHHIAHQHILTPGETNHKHPVPQIAGKVDVISLATGDAVPRAQVQAVHAAW
jgi:hypothetical protein